TPTAASSALPAALTAATRRTVLSAAGGTAAGLGAASPRVTALADGLAQALSVARLRVVIVTGLALGLSATGAGLGVRALNVTRPAPTRPETDPQVATRPGVRPTIRRDAYGDPLPDAVQARLGTTRFS